MAEEEFVRKNPLPKEDLPPEGKTGASFGWPPGIMNQAMAATLRSEGITKTSQLFVLVHSISQESFGVFVEGAEGKDGELGNPRGLHDVVRMWLARPDMKAKFRERIVASHGHSCKWTGADYTFMIGLLTTVPNRPPLSDGEARENAERYLQEFQTIGYPVWRATHTDNCARGRSL